VVEVSPRSPPRVILDPIATDGPTVTPIASDPALSTCAADQPPPTAITIQLDPERPGLVVGTAPDAATLRSASAPASAR
jgi:hypothetical protein